MPNVEFVLKTMCVLPYTRIRVTERFSRDNRKYKVLGTGTYEKVISRYGSRQVMNSFVANDVLYIDVFPTIESCGAFTCRLKDSCILLECQGDKCPLCCDRGLCKICVLAHACKM